MDTIIFAVLLVTGIFAAKGAKGKIVIPLWILSIVLIAVLFKHHVTDPLPLEF